MADSTADPPWGSSAQDGVDSRSVEPYPPRTGHTGPVATGGRHAPIALRGAVERNHQSGTPRPMRTLGGEHTDSIWAVHSDGIIVGRVIPIDIGPRPRRNRAGADVFAAGRGPATAAP